ncbi:MAG: hypothetical protein LUP99_00165, partial [Methanomicrobiales archaeon]|nr:hypothetical protein [Methanomicrobiales archaeon]
MCATMRQIEEILMSVCSHPLEEWRCQVKKYASPNPFQFAIPFYDGETGGYTPAMVILTLSTHE